MGAHDSPRGKKTTKVWGFGLICKVEISHPYMTLGSCTNRPPHSRNGECAFAWRYHSITHGRTGRLLRSLHKPTEIVFAGVPRRSAARGGTLTVFACGQVAVSRSVR